MWSTVDESQCDKASETVQILAALAEVIMLNVHDSGSMIRSCVFFLELNYEHKIPFPGTNNS